MWESIKWLMENNFQELHLGRTDLDHEGLRRFKTSWGVKEIPIHYWCYDIQSGTFRISHSGSLGISKEILSRMPIFLLTQIGKLIYRHGG